MPDVSTLGLAVDSSGVRKATDDLGKFASAGGKAEASTRDYESAVKQAEKAGASFGLAIGGAITAVVGLTTSVIALASAAGDYQDIADKIGSDNAAGFASLRTSADVAGVSLDKLATDSVRLSTNLSKVDDESKGAGKALEAIGLTVEGIKNLAPEDQFRAIAKALGEYAESGQKAAVATALYRDPEALKFLKELGQETETVTYLTNEQIKRADDFSDASKRTRSQILQLAQAIATETLPAISAFLGAVKETAAEMAGVTSESKTLGAETGVRDFAEGAATALGSVIDAGDGVVRTFKSVGLATGAAAAAAAAAARGDFGQAKSIIGELGSDIDDLLSKEQFSAKLARQMADAKRASSIDMGSGDGWDAKKKLNFDAQKDSVAKVRDEYTSLIKRIQEKTAAEQAEFDSVEKLLPAQTEAAKVASDYASGLLKLTPVQLANVDAALAAQLAIERLNKARADEKKWIDEATTANASYVEQQMAYRDQLEAKRRDAVLDLQEYGKTREELQALEVARLRDAAAALQQKAAQADNAYLEENARLYREQADQLIRTADARQALAGRQATDRNDPLAGAQRGVTEYLDEVKRAGDATAAAVSNSLHGLEDVTVAVLTGHGGKDAARQWVDGIIAEITRLYVVKPLLASIFGGSGGSGSSVLGAVASYFNFGSSGNNYNGSSGSNTAPNYTNGADVGFSFGKSSGPIENKSGGSDASASGGAGAGAMPSIQIINQTSEKVADAKANRLPDGTIQLVLKAAVSAAAASVKSGGEMHEAIAGAYQLNRAGSAPRY